MTDDEWRALLAERDAKIAELEARIEELLAVLGQNSLNSSLPPSRDSKDAKEKRRERAAKHAKRREKEARRKNRAKRELLPPEKVTSSVRRPQPEGRVRRPTCRTPPRAVQ